MNNIKIGKRIRSLREDKGITQSKLASDLGYKSNAVISKLERGESELTAMQIRKITKYFDISSDYLLEGKKDGVLYHNYDGITKEVKIKNKLSFIKRKDFILFGGIFIVLILSMFFNDENRDVVLVVLSIYAVIYLAYMIIVKFIRNKERIEKVNLPINKNVEYLSTLDNKTISKYKNNNIIVGILVIIINIFFYGVLITIMNEEFPTSLLSLVTIVFFLLLFKITIFVLNSNLKSKDVTFVSLMILGVELLINSVYLFHLSSNNLITFQILILATFSIASYLLSILITDFYLSKFYYVIE